MTHKYISISAQHPSKRLNSSTSTTMTTYADLPPELCNKIIDALVFLCIPPLKLSQHFDPWTWSNTHRTAADTTLKKQMSILRLVSHDLNVLATPVLLHTLRLEFPTLETSERTEAEATRCSEVIAALATGSYASGNMNFTTDIFRHTRKLEFAVGDYFRPQSSFDPLHKGAAEIIVRQHLAHAVAALENLETAM